MIIKDLILFTAGKVADAAKKVVKAPGNFANYLGGRIEARRQVAERQTVPPLNGQEALDLENFVEGALSDSEPRARTRPIVEESIYATSEEILRMTIGKLIEDADKLYQSAKIRTSVNSSCVKEGGKIVLSSTAQESYGEAMELYEKAALKLSSLSIDKQKLVMHRIAACNYGIGVDLKLKKKEPSEILPFFDKAYNRTKNLLELDSEYAASNAIYQSVVASIGAVHSELATGEDRFKIIKDACEKYDNKTKTSIIYNFVEKEFNRNGGKPSLEVLGQLYSLYNTAELTHTESFSKFDIESKLLLDANARAEQSPAGPLALSSVEPGLYSVVSLVPEEGRRGSLI